MDKSVDQIGQELRRIAIDIKLTSDVEECIYWIIAFIDAVGIDYRTVIDELEDEL